jgi:hypothetical protein
VDWSLAAALLTLGLGLGVAAGVALGALAERRRGLPDASALARELRAYEAAYGDEFAPCASCDGLGWVARDEARP